MDLFDFIKLKQELFKQEKYESLNHTEKRDKKQKLYQELCFAKAEKLYGFILRDLRNGNSSYWCPDDFIMHESDNCDMVLLDEEPANICNKLLNERLSDFDFKYKYNKIFGQDTPNFYKWEWSLKNKNNKCKNTSNNSKNSCQFEDSKYKNSCNFGNSKYKNSYQFGDNKCCNFGDSKYKNSCNFGDSKCCNFGDSKYKNSC